VSTSPILSGVFPTNHKVQNMRESIPECFSNSEIVTDINRKHPESTVLHGAMALDGRHEDFALSFLPSKHLA
jgi:hypothetical protein